MSYPQQGYPGAYYQAAGAAAPQAGYSRSKSCTMITLVHTANAKVLLWKRARLRCS